LKGCPLNSRGSFGLFLLLSLLVLATCLVNVQAPAVASSWGECGRLRNRSALQEPSTLCAQEEADVVAGLPRLCHGQIIQAVAVGLWMGFKVVWQN